MKIAILTCEEMLYLPAFFDRFLQHRAKDVVGVFQCPPLYKDQTLFSQVKRYRKAFGVCSTLRLIWRVLAAKTKGRLGVGKKTGKFYSVPAAARAHGVHEERVSDVNAPEFRERMKELGVEVILSVSCPQIFKAELISIPSLGCLNLHGADLPKYRGLIPSFWMLADGLSEAGVTIFFVDAGVDTGEVLGKRLFPILPDDTLDSFIVRAKREACDLALEALDQIDNGTASSAPLEGEGSYFSYPTREAYRRFLKQGHRLW